MNGRLTIRTVGTAGTIRLARLLKAKAPSLSCGACGGRDFGLVEAPDEGWRTILTRSLIFPGAEPMRIEQTLVTVICTNCGHLHQFAEAVLNGAVASQYGEDRTNE